ATAPSDNPDLGRRTAGCKPWSSTFLAKCFHELTPAPTIQEGGLWDKLQSNDFRLRWFELNVTSGKHPI
ncbi:MAG: hypothetical protein Q8O40_17930, partial [Chloroflexota bacterium]|nr:hypothetical protein [Chloroflexota bacterium]